MWLATRVHIIYLLKTSQQTNKQIKSTTGLFDPVSELVTSSYLVLRVLRIMQMCQKKKLSLSHLICMDVYFCFRFSSKQGQFFIISLPCLINPLWTLGSMVLLVLVRLHVFYSCLHLRPRAQRIQPSFCSSIRLTQTESGFWRPRPGGQQRREVHWDWTEKQSKANCDKSSELDERDRMADRRSETWLQHVLSSRQAFV